MPATCVYHIDSVESTSKRYTLQLLHVSDIPYWLCGVNFKTTLRADGNLRPYTILTLWSQLQNPMAIAVRAMGVYHIDSVESTSKRKHTGRRKRNAYTILTLWSQLQNDGAFVVEPTENIPYWLCGVNFKTQFNASNFSLVIYHIDSVESTSKQHPHGEYHSSRYTILTLWSQLQNTFVQFLNK